MTDYIILRSDDDSESWDEHSGVRASSPQRALRIAQVEAGTYVAVPARSWKPLTVKVENTVKITIG